MLRSLKHPMIMLMLVCMALLPAAGTAQAQTSQRCFAATGQCISGPIRQYWESHGGLPVFGYPITNQRTEDVEGRSLTVQWFERDRLEIQPEGYITAGRLGALYLELLGRYWQPGSLPQPTPYCRIFSQTGYEVCGRFLEYWNRNGGLERFGYPITEAVKETVEGQTYTVQYFERRRMEYHPEFAGSQYEVLLGLLGRDINTAAFCPNAQTPELGRAVRRFLFSMGCPLDGGRVMLQAAVQRYEHGVMLWIEGVDTTINPPLIFILAYDPQVGRQRWQVRVDTWQPGDSMGSEQPPPGKVAPANGFGKIWWNDPSIRQSLGWAMENEQKSTGTLIAFPRSTWMFQTQNPGWIVVMSEEGFADVYLAGLI